MSFFVELSIIVGIALIITLICKILKQPTIIAYIITGIIVSPYFLNISSQSSNLNIFSQIGVAILLFMVGLGLNPKVIKEVGKVALITGIGQILFTTIIAYIIGISLGLSSLTAIYIAVAISFSSTIVIMKILSDKEETNTLYGKISIGFLIVQDIVAIIILIFISSVSHSGNLSEIVLEKLGYGLALLIILIILTYTLIPKVTKFAARSQELLLLLSISWALIVASTFEHFGFSIEIGALLAGMSLSLSNYRYEISAKMKPLRDFFLLIFFIVLGSQMTFDNFYNNLNLALIFSIIILVGNPIIVLSLMGNLGYTKRTGFLSGLTVSQISEFSFILVALGIKMGHLESNLLSLMTMVGLITMAGSTYALMYSNSLYNLLSSPLSIFEKKVRKVDERNPITDKKFDVILFGYNRIGYSLVKSFKKKNISFIIVDYNPETINNLMARKVPVMYGDASDLELLEELPLKEAKMIISTIPDIEINSMLIRKVKQKNKDCQLLVVSHHIDDSLSLYKGGADYVITPHFLGGSYIAKMIEDSGINKTRIKEEKEINIKELLERNKEGHKDPLHERG